MKLVCARLLGPVVEPCPIVYIVRGRRGDVSHMSHRIVEPQTMECLDGGVDGGLCGRCDSCWHSLSGDDKVEGYKTHTTPKT